MATYSLSIDTGAFSSRTFPVRFGNYRLSITSGTFASTEYTATLTVKTSFSLTSGTFQSYGNFAALYLVGQMATNIDNLASGAPYPAPSFFVPIIKQVQPPLVLSPDDVYGQDGTLANTIYVDYYNPDTLMWDDVSYQNQYPGQTIPEDLKQSVASQTYSYNVYVIAIAAYNALYAAETVYQWPYYFAKQAIARY